MWRVMLMAVMLAGCVQPPFSPADIQAKRFEAVPGKSVIYIVRDHPDFNDAGATIKLGESAIITTYPGTYYRWEVEPGQHRISGYAADAGWITLTTEPGKIYFVQQRLAPPFMSFPQSWFAVIAEPYGRAAVGRAVPVGGS